MPAPDCPSADDLYPALVQLLPPGEAWPAHDSPQVPTVQSACFYALAQEIGRMEEAFCQVYSEIFAHSADLDADLWQTEYGLPNASDAFGTDFLTKLRAPVQWQNAPSDFERLAFSLGWAVAAAWATPTELHLTIDSASSPALSTFIPTAVGSMVVGGGGSVLGSGPNVSPLVSALDSVVPAESILTYTVV